jgi:hypothetical protein
MYSVHFVQIEGIKFYLSPHQFMGIWIVSSLGCHKQGCNDILAQVFLRTHVSTSLSAFLEEEFLDNSVA